MSNSLHKPDLEFNLDYSTSKINKKDITKLAKHI